MIIKRVCIVDSIYALLLYFLISTEEEIKNTFYFTGTGVPESIRKNLPNRHSFKKQPTLLRRLFLKLSLNFFSHLRWNFLKTAKIFGQDHIQFFSTLVRNRNYTLLEDAPLVFSNFTNSHIDKQNRKLRTSWSIKIVNLLYGKIFATSFGQNSQCENIILTKEEDLKYLPNKQTTLIDLQNIWQVSSKSKQELVLKLFNIDLSAPIFTTKKSIIILTQPFYVDVPNFSEQEQIDLYKEIVERYDKSEVVIKTHPRDKINYCQYFLDIEIFDKPIPMQLLSILGVRFEKAVTIFSSAVLDFPYKIKVEKIGMSCRKKIENYFELI